MVRSHNFPPSSRYPHPSHILHLSSFLTTIWIRSFTFTSWCPINVVGLPWPWSLATSNRDKDWLAISSCFVKEEIFFLKGESLGILQMPPKDPFRNLCLVAYFIVFENLPWPHRILLFFSSDVDPIQALLQTHPFAGPLLSYIPLMKPITALQLSLL